MPKTVLLGVSSGIAAYKVVDLAENLQQAGVRVRVIITHHATKMVDPLQFTKVTGEPVFTELYGKDFDYQKILKDKHVEHIDLADEADIFVVVPATANVVAKLANGIADDLLTTTALAVTAPTILCPSMNVHMWSNPAVQQNIAKLKSLGYQIIEPATGPLACGYEGQGRLENIDIIQKEILQALEKNQQLIGKKIIITAGGTQEKIDEVRYIMNKSSGKMGVALAEACHQRGADVLLLRAANSVEPRYQIPQKTFTSADELLTLIEESAPSYDVIFHAAAVADFQPEKTFRGKLDSNKKIHLTLTPRPKILDQIKKMNPKITVIAFKAEHEPNEKKLVALAQKRLAISGADAIIANDISRTDRGFQADTNEVFIISKNKKTHRISLNSKKIVAEQILDHLHRVII